MSQQHIDAFYRKHGDCCAGCDYWRWYNSVAGECIKSAPSSGEGRFAMLGITCSSMTPDAGHIVTPRNHVCGEFIDTLKDKP